jgi:hypothetical protein
MQLPHAFPSRSTLVVSIGHNRFLILHTVFLLDVLASQALQNPTPMSTKAKSEVSAAIRIAGVSTIVGAVSIAVAVLAIQDTGTESSFKLHPELLVLCFYQDNRQLDDLHICRRGSNSQRKNAGMGVSY